MNLNQSVLIKAAGIGAGIALLWGVGRNIPIANFACCCLGWLVWLGVGASYGYFDHQSGGRPDMGQYALGGAVVGAVAGLVLGITSGIFAFVFNMLGISAAAAIDYSQYGMPPELASQMAAQGGITIVSALTGACFSLIWVAVLGAVGGVLYVALRGNQGQGTMSPPPPAV